MSLILSWALFPLLLTALGAGWGFLVERAAGARLPDALLVPLGLAAALVLAGTLDAFDATAPAAVVAVAAGALAGLPLAWAGRRRLGGWAALAALGVLLVYGAPVLLSGHATFAGFVRLDDTATWFNIVDHLASGPHAGGGPPSTYALEYATGIGPEYPRGAFALAGVARALSGVDIAWVFQPYLACCAAALALCLHELARPLVPRPWARAAIAFLAAQSALLYGYSLWGGIKELTAAFLLALMAALAAALLGRRPEGPRRLLPLAIAAAAMLQTLGAGAAGWVLATFAFLAGSWLLAAPRGERRRAAPAAVVAAWLGGLTAVLIVPVWIVLGSFLSSDSGLFSSGQSEQVRLGNLIHPLSGFQLAGIWPVGDFRLDPPALPTVLLVGLALAAAAVALWTGVRRRRLGLALYVTAALGACALLRLAGATPWVIGKTLAISAPALLLAALTGGALLARRWRAAIVVPAALAFGVLWSNALAYHDVLLAPRARLAELQRIGELVAGKSPTLLNEYDIYASEHFLRDGAPVGPAEYRPVDLALRDGALLTKAAWADLDSLPLATLEEYRSIVTRRSPAESRPPSNYRLTWRGRYYELWQRPPQPAANIVAHVPLGESTTLPYCGAASNAPTRPLCSLDPAAVPRCAQVEAIGRRAAALDARLVAYRRAGPVVARGDQTLWPAEWLHNPEERTLTARTAGTAIAHIALASSQPYELWLGGSFARGFDVAVDGRPVGAVENELTTVGGWVPVASLFLRAGVHTIAIEYPRPDLSPGSGDDWFTSLSAIALQPQRPLGRTIVAAPGEARRLCGQPLDWIEIVTPG